MNSLLRSALEYHQSGEIELAKKTYLKVIAQVQGDELAFAYYQLGNIFFHKRDYALAGNYFQLAINIDPLLIEARYNLALIFVKENNAEAAARHFLTIIQYRPTHLLAQHHLGNFYYTQGSYQQAAKHYHQVVNSEPEFNAIFNLACCYLLENQLSLAGKYFTLALDFKTDDTASLYNLGVIALTKKQLADAEYFFTKVLALQPDHSTALHNYMVTLLKLNKRMEASHYLQQLIALHPDNVDYQFLLAAISQDTPSFRQAPANYITTLFDHYANHFESHLEQSLDYHLPEQISQLLARHLPAAQHELLILDLGCGSGLAGLQVKPWAHHLCGIDLSKNMLDLAMQKNCYDQLIHAPFEQAMLSFSEVDLILSADAMIYIGDVEPLFRACQRILKQNGYLLFNTEMTLQQNYVLTATGRYAHNVNYIQQLADTYQLRLIEHQAIIPRQQHGQPVHSHLWLFCNTTNPARNK